MSEYITTYTGKHFKPTEPDPELFDIADIAHALSLICRGNGHMKTFWSVGEHCICCAKEAKARGLSDRMVLACLLHDASECYMSDVPSPFKKELPEYNEREERMLCMIYEKFLGSDLTPEEKMQLNAIDKAMLWYDLTFLLGEKQESEAPELHIDLRYEVRAFGEVEEYRMIFARFPSDDLSYGSLLSYNGRDQVQGWIYVPACKPKGIVQVIHGFGEHSRRYLHMISAFMDAGYIVAADDHVGHGKTAMVNNVWGDWGDKGPHTMMEDEHTLKGIVCEKYPDLPYFLFGHSMGSFITRDFIAKYGDELAGATICGTTGIFRGAEETGKKLKEAIDAGHGEESDPSYTEELMGWMCERCGEVSIGNEWICADPYVQRDDADDPFDAFTRPTSNRSVYDFIQMMLADRGNKVGRKCADRPANL